MVAPIFTISPLIPCPLSRVRASGRDREDLRDRGDVLGVVGTGRTENGSDFDQSGVAGLDVVAAVVLEVVEESSCVRDGEGIEIDPVCGNTERGG